MADRPIRNFHNHLYELFFSSVGTDVTYPGNFTLSPDTLRNKLLQ